MVPPNAKHQVQMPPVVACPHCRANIQLPPGAPIVACPVCHTCIQMAFAPPPPVMQTGPSLQPGPSFAHTPVTPTPVATWQQPGQHQPPAPQDAYRVSIDPPGGDSTIREVSIFNARPRSLLNFRRDRTVVVHRSSEGSTGEMVKVCELLPGKYHHVEGQKVGTKWDARDASTGKVLLEWIIAEWTPIGPAADPRPAPVVQRTIVGSWRSPLRLLTPSEWDTDMDHWDEPVDDNAGPDFDCCPTTTPYHERVMYYTCLRHTLFFCFFIRSSDPLTKRLRFMSLLAVVFFMWGSTIMLHFQSGPNIIAQAIVGGLVSTVINASFRLNRKFGCGGCQIGRAFGFTCVFVLFLFALVLAVSLAQNGVQDDRDRDGDGELETADFMDVFEPFCYALLVKWFVMEFIEIFVRVGMYGSCGGFGRCFGVGPRMFRLGNCVASAAM